MCVCGGGEGGGININNVYTNCHKKASEDCCFDMILRLVCRAENDGKFVVFQHEPLPNHFWVVVLASSLSFLGDWNYDKRNM